MTQRVCAPRAVFIQYPFGRLLGGVGDREGQQTIGSHMVEWLASADRRNSYLHLPYEWPEPSDETKWRSDEPPPIGRQAEAEGVRIGDMVTKAMQEAEVELLRLASG